MRCPRFDLGCARSLGTNWEKSWRMEKKPGFGTAFFLNIKDEGRWIRRPSGPGDGGDPSPGPTSDNGGQPRKHDLSSWRSWICAELASFRHFVLVPTGTVGTRRDP